MHAGDPGFDDQRLRPVVAVRDAESTDLIHDTLIGSSPGLVEKHWARLSGMMFHADRFLYVRKYESGVGPNMTLMCPSCGMAEAGECREHWNVRGARILQRIVVYKRHRQGTPAHSSWQGTQR